MPHGLSQNAHWQNGTSHGRRCCSALTQTQNQIQTVPFVACSLPLATFIPPPVPRGPATSGQKGTQEAQQSNSQFGLRNQKGDGADRESPWPTRNDAMSDHKAVRPVRKCSHPFRCPKTLSQCIQVMVVKGTSQQGKWAVPFSKVNTQVSCPADEDNGYNSHVEPHATVFPCLSRSAGKPFPHRWSPVVAG